MSTQAIVELLKLSLSVYFALAKMKDVSEEDLDKIYQEEKAKFILNDPDKLEDV